MNDCRMVSIVNWKGGVGKTTITHHLGTGLQVLDEGQRLEHLGQEEAPRVLFVDNDAQCNLTVSCLGSDRFEKMLDKGLKTMRDLYGIFLRDDEPVVKVEDFILEGAARKSASQSFERVDLLPAHPDLVYTDMDFAVYNRPELVRKQFFILLRCARYDIGNRCGKMLSVCDRNTRIRVMRRK